MFVVAGVALICVTIDVIVVYELVILVVEIEVVGGIIV